ncbi:MAG TPA: GTPase domain-containing protein [Candidatus Deferrimicrobium sp.]|nr:GTPase domain-containing protein [Candidatus Deferrimicrobium sp.]
MVSINYSSREVCCKIVYYGPGLSGKTTNLQYVHSKVPVSTRGKLISLATDADRTLYFDFLPLNIGTVNGFAAKFQLYTVPGQVYYNATRKLVLRGVDGVVFVADSQADKMDENIESLVNLEENLREYGYDLNDLPLVVQYNKRDLPGVLPVEKLEALLNSRGWPFFEASAVIGNGVFDTLKLIIKLVLERAKSSSAARPRPAAAGAMVGGESAGSAVIADERTDLTRSQPMIPPSVKAAGVSPGAATFAATHAAERESKRTRGPELETPGAGTSGTEAAEGYQYRPYPGSEQFQAVQTDSPTRKAERPKIVHEPSGTGTEGHEIEVLTTRQRGAPTMAPPLYRRSEKKKRGFFKRLFGLK